MAVLTPAVKQMYMSFLLLTTRSEIGKYLTEEGKGLTFAQLKGKLEADAGADAYPAGFLDAHADIVAPFLGDTPQAQKMRDALQLIQVHFRKMGGLPPRSIITWNVEPCPKGAERIELQGHVLH